MVHVRSTLGWCFGKSSSEYVGRTIRCFVKSSSKYVGVAAQEEEMEGDDAVIEFWIHQKC